MPSHPFVFHPYVLNVASHPDINGHFLWETLATPLYNSFDQFPQNTTVSGFSTKKAALILANVDSMGLMGNPSHAFTMRNHDFWAADVPNLRNFE